MHALYCVGQKYRHPLHHVNTASVHKYIVCAYNNMSALHTLPHMNRLMSVTCAVLFEIATRGKLSILTVTQTENSKQYVETANFYMYIFHKYTYSCALTIFILKTNHTLWVHT